MLKTFQKLRFFTYSFTKPSLCLFSETKLPDTPSEEFTSEMTPKKTVQYLDQFIIGQPDAKKAMAIALSIILSYFKPQEIVGEEKDFPKTLDKKSIPKIFSW
jgi:hypothetical protein